MRRKYSTELVTLLVLAASLVQTTPALACSSRLPPALADLVPGEALPDGHPDARVVGVYEFEYLARSPRLLISGPRAVTIVTRYWESHRPTWDWK